MDVFSSALVSLKGWDSSGGGMIKLAHFLAEFGPTCDEKRCHNRWILVGRGGRGASAFELDLRKKEAPGGSENRRILVAGGDHWAAHFVTRLAKQGGPRRAHKSLDSSAERGAWGREFLARFSTHEGPQRTHRSLHSSGERGIVLRSWPESLRQDQLSVDRHLHAQARAPPWPLYNPPRRRPRCYLYN